MCFSVKAFTLAHWLALLLLALSLFLTLDYLLLACFLCIFLASVFLSISFFELDFPFHVYFLASSLLLQILLSLSLWFHFYIYACFSHWLSELSHSPFHFSSFFSLSICFLALRFNFFWSPFFHAFFLPFLRSSNFHEFSHFPQCSSFFLFLLFCLHSCLSYLLQFWLYLMLFLVSYCLLCFYTISYSSQLFPSFPNYLPFCLLSFSLYIYFSLLSLYSLLNLSAWNVSPCIVLYYSRDYYY